jgi:hypothetical protein
LVVAEDDLLLDFPVTAILASTVVIVAPGTNEAQGENKQETADG